MTTTHRFKLSDVRDFRPGAALLARLGPSLPGPAAIAALFDALVASFPAAPLPILSGVDHRDPTDLPGILGELLRVERFGAELWGVCSFIGDGVPMRAAAHGLTIAFNTAGRDPTTGSPRGPRLVYVFPASPGRDRLLYPEASPEAPAVDLSAERWEEPAPTGVLRGALFQSYFRRFAEQDNPGVQLAKEEREATDEFQALLVATEAEVGLLVRGPGAPAERHEIRVLGIHTSKASTTATSGSTALGWGRVALVPKPNVVISEGVPGLLLTADRIPPEMRDADGVPSGLVLLTGQLRAAENGLYELVPHGSGDAFLRRPLASHGGSTSRRHIP